MLKKFPQEKWNWYQPPFLRFWIKRNMIPVAIDSALQKRQKWSYIYLIWTCGLFHWIVYDRFIKEDRKQATQTSDANIPEEIEMLMATNKSGANETTIYRFDNFSLKEKVIFNEEEWRKSRQEA